MNGTKKKNNNLLKKTLQKDNINIYVSNIIICKSGLSFIPYA